jgi:DNA-binding transcriptional ArsR family regulator
MEDTVTPAGSDADGAIRTSDPERIRALAHPVRLALLEYLDQVQQATATDCARHTGETVANCSFHLRTLGKYGFIEPAERNGRERPWRATSSRTFEPDITDSATVRATVELASLVVERESARVVAFLHDTQSRWLVAGEGNRATAVIPNGFWGTLDEAAEVIRTLTHLTDRFADRDSDPSARPEGARRLHLFATVNPDLVADDMPAPRSTAPVDADSPIEER